MISVDEALERMAAATACLSVVDLPWTDALGHVLAEPIAADEDRPSAARSAMDGFALRSVDASPRGSDLRIVGEVRAGQAPRVAVGPGEALRIMTGGLLPAGADAVIPVERTREDRAAGTVHVDGVVSHGAHVRQRGSELRRGDALIEPARRIDAAAIAVLATAGRSAVRVHRRPVVHVLSTGDELVPSDRAVESHQIHNSNGPMLLALLAEQGLVGHDLGIVGDEPEALHDRLEIGLNGDVLLVTGGVSVGEYDLVAKGLHERGVEQLLHGVAIKPGKPVMVGRRGNCLVVALPGNPVSALTLFVVLVVPILRRMCGERQWRHVPLPVTVAEALPASPGRTTYHLARLMRNPEGLAAKLVHSAGSGDLTALPRADAFVVIPRDAPAVPARTRAEALAWRVRFDVGTSNEGGDNELPLPGS